MNLNRIILLMLFMVLPIYSMESESSQSENEKEYKSTQSNDNENDIDQEEEDEGESEDEIVTVVYRPKYDSPDYFFFLSEAKIINSSEPQEKLRYDKNKIVQMQKLRRLISTYQNGSEELDDKGYIRIECLKHDEEEFRNGLKECNLLVKLCKKKSPEFVGAADPNTQEDNAEKSGSPYEIVTIVYKPKYSRPERYIGKKFEELNAAEPFSAFTPKEQIEQMKKLRELITTFANKEELSDGYIHLECQKNDEDYLRSCLKKYKSLLTLCKKNSSAEVVAADTKNEAPKETAIAINVEEEMASQMTTPQKVKQTTTLNTYCKMATVFTAAIIVIYGGVCIWAFTNHV